MLIEQFQTIVLGHLRKVAVGVQSCHFCSGLPPNTTFRRIVIRDVAHKSFDSTFAATFQDSREFSKKRNQS